MPKKGKKGKKGKGGKKGKKKDADKEEAIGKIAERNANLWEARIRMVEYHKDHYKDTAKQLVEENTSLIDHMRQTEKDTIDIVSYLRKIDAEKESEIAKLQYELKNIRSNHQAEKDQLISEFTAKINDYEEQLQLKTVECSSLQNELNQLKEFRKKKIQMQRELEEIKEAMILNEMEHKEHTQRIETKFYEEKMKLQIEANKKIEELAEKAHDTAIQNMDEISKNIYRENIQLSEAAKMNNLETVTLKKLNRTLTEKCDNYKQEAAVQDMLTKEKVAANSKLLKTNKELKNKIEILEKSLSQIVKEFEIERGNFIQKCKIELESSSTEIQKLNKTLELKNKEMNKIKKLAKNILEQRNDIERFFLDAIDYVRKQIITNRNEYRKEASAVYNNKMLAAHLGQAEYPRIRTFTKKFDGSSTNNVYRDLEQAEKWNLWKTDGKSNIIESSIDLVDLTWEQKEQVLRELFAKMNGVKLSKSASQKGNLTLAHLLDKMSNDGEDNDDGDEDDDNDKASLHYGSRRNKITNSANALAKSMMNEDYTFITQSSARVDDILEQKSVEAKSAVHTADSHTKLPAITPHN